MIRMETFPVGRYQAYMDERGHFSFWEQDNKAAWISCENAPHLHDFR